MRTHAQACVCWSKYTTKANKSYRKLLNLFASSYWWSFGSQLLAVLYLVPWKCQYQKLDLVKSTHPSAEEWHGCHSKNSKATWWKSFDLVTGGRFSTALWWAVVKNRNSIKYRRNIQHISMVKVVQLAFANRMNHFLYLAMAWRITEPLLSKQAVITLQELTVFNDINVTDLSDFVWGFGLYH